MPRVPTSSPAVGPRSSWYGARRDRIAERVAGLVATELTDIRVAAAAAHVPGETRVRTVIVAHELIWQITEALVASGAVVPPECVGGSRPEDTPTELLFVLR